jgi:type II secretory pathway pseudopilin PulG
MKKSTLISIIAVIVLIAAGITYATWHSKKVSQEQSAEQKAAATQLAETQKAQDAKDKEDITKLITDFGAVLKDVPLSGSKAVAAAASEKYYAPFVSRAILDAWESDPEKAPGRVTSSPWPDRIEISSLDLDPDDGSYTAQGYVIEITSVEVSIGSNSSASKYPIAMKLRKQNDRWIITGFVKGS